jgi:hypothetical protein
MAPEIRIDHIVALASSPAEAAREFAPLGLAARPGGRHAAWGTMNVLMPLERAYFELLGVEDPSVAADSGFGRSVLSGMTRGDGLWRVALGTDDMAGTLGRLAEQGIAYEGPIPGERLRPDGTSLRWQLAFPQGPADGGTPPMLIAWEESAQAPYAPQGEPAASVAWIAFAATRPHEVAEWYARAFSLEPREEPATEFGAAWRVPCLGGDLLFLGGAGASPDVQAIIAREGPGPFAVALRRAGARDAAVMVGRGRYRLATR